MMQEVFEKLKARIHKEDMEFMQQADLMECIDSIIDEFATDYNNGWISVEERTPEEHDTFFSKFYGTDRWMNGMARKMSDNVNVTVEYEDGKRTSKTAFTADGKWEQRGVVKGKVIAWQPLPEPFRSDEQEEKSEN